MLSIEQAYEQQDRYHGNERVRGAISETALIAFVGGTAVGKNFLMEKSGLPIAGTETTRAPRADDDPSRYTYSDLPTMLEAIQAGELVQYGVSLPEHIYASRVHDYSLGQPNVADIWHDAVQPLGNKGFSQVRSVSVLTPKAQWMSQLWERFEGMRIGDIDRRLSEARHSLRWTLAQHLGGAANHLVVINHSDQVDENLERIVSFAHGIPADRSSNDAIRGTADEMFSTIDIMYGRLSA